MGNDALSHHGILGMRWGVRRYQNKDGSLTLAGKKRRKQTEEETVEERRARLLKSTDASELYKNRGLLTTSELNERINRIDTERRLANIAGSTKKSGMDTVDKALAVGRKINSVYEFTNTPVMKALKKQLGIEKAEKRLGLDEVYKLRDKLSDKELSDALRRANTEKAIKKLLDESSKAVDEAKQQKSKMDYYNTVRSEPHYDGGQPYRVKYDTVSSTPIRTKENGRNTVAGLLEAPKNNTPIGLLTDGSVTTGQQVIAGLLEAPK